MSSSGQQGGSGQDDRRGNMGRYVKRLKTVLRRGSSQRESHAAAGSSKEPEREEPTSSTAQAATTSTAETPAAVPATSESAAVPVISASHAGQHARSEAQQERARALFAKYGLTLEAHEWLSTGSTGVTVQRVEKPIRLRVTRTCHRCQTTFGADRVCTNCEHRRCQKCPRYPRKKTKAEEKQPASTPKPPAKGPAPKLTITTRDGKQQVRNPIKQRVRRTCHHCNSLFIPPTRTECESCRHTRCTKCPREPPKLKKYPDGYPGDAPASESEAEPRKIARSKDDWTFKKPRQRVRWTCENCRTLFRQGSKLCDSCGHERGSENCNCQREPPKKIKKEPDPEVVKSVEAKLADFKFNEPPTISTAA